MESSPIEDAVAEQERVRAIHDRARAKLKAARGDEEQQRKTSSWVSSALARPGMIVALFVLAPLPLWLVLLLPESLHWATWAEEPTFPFSVLVSVYTILYAWTELRRRRRATSVETTVRDFYSAASCHNGAAEALSEFIIEADLDGSERPPPAYYSNFYRPALIDAKTVARYWTYLAKPTSKFRYLFRVEDVGVSQLEPDLCLAQVKLRAVPVRRNSPFVYFVLGGGFAVAMALDGLPSPNSWEYFGLVTLVVLLGLAYTRWRIRRGKVYRVRKLLVRCGRDWRFFCADWQGYEERDLSWLDGDDTT